MKTTLKKKVPDNFQLKGILTFDNFLIEHPRAAQIDRYLKYAVNIPAKKWGALMQEMRSLCQVKTLVKHNMVVLTGRAALARVLVGDGTYGGEINYGLLGGDATAVTDADTTLVDEIFRKVVATRLRTDDSAIIRFYYSRTETDGTYEEFGTVIAGTSSADTGQLFNRALTGGWTKSASESMTVSLQLTINPL